MKKFAWLFMFLSLGLFTLGPFMVGCGGPASENTLDTTVDEEEAEEGMNLDVEGGGEEQEDA